MGATGTPTINPTKGTGAGDVHASGMHNADLVFATITLSSSYSTGGDTLTFPYGATAAQSRGKRLRAVVVLRPADGTRIYSWNGSTSAPTIQAFTAIATEVTAATNLSAVTLPVLFVFED